MRMSKNCSDMRVTNSSAKTLRFWCLNDSETSPANDRANFFTAPEAQAMGAHGSYSRVARMAASFLSKLV